MCIIWLLMLMLHVTSLTRNATLAELTSLEELMRTLYDDSRVDGEVISTLWQVYSK